MHKSADTVNAGIDGPDAYITPLGKGIQEGKRKTRSRGLNVFREKILRMQMLAQQCYKFKKSREGRTNLRKWEELSEMIEMRNERDLRGQSVWKMKENHT